MKRYYIYRKDRKKKIYFNEETGFYTYRFGKETGWENWGYINKAQDLFIFFFGNRRISIKTLKYFCQNHTVKNFDSIVPKGSEYTYLILDEKNKTVDLFSLFKSFCHIKSNNYKYTYRKDPVPNIGKNKYYNYYRHFPKTEVEDLESIKEAKKYTRNFKIKTHKTPSFWDDIPRLDYKDRNWKRYRKHQYKFNKPSYKNLYIE